VLLGTSLKYHFQLIYDTNYYLGHNKIFVNMEQNAQEDELKTEY